VVGRASRRRSGKRSSTKPALLFAAPALLVLAGAGTPSGASPRRSPSPVAHILTRATAPRALPGGRIRSRGERIDLPEVAIGERLFLETRFAQFFATHMAGSVNDPLVGGDPALAVLRTSVGPLRGPFSGRSMNCRNCHLVDDVAGAPTRTYDDYSRRSLVPLREDGITETPRNSPTLVNATLPRPGPLLLHYDGEFASLGDLVRATLTGRNYGWLPTERAEAAAHIARIVREDDGSGDLGRRYGGAYRAVLLGTDPGIPAAFRLPEQFRLDVARASDEQILDVVARLISAYVRSLTFEKKSPYDVFLEKNSLPAAPLAGEPDLRYSRRLRAAVDALEAPRYVGPEDGEFTQHDQEFAFGPEELKGLKIFFREPLPGTLAGDPRVLSTRTGNCIACHAAPYFTDFAFHNTGATEEEYDAAHGEGAFRRLFIPDLDYRSARYEDFLPPTPVHPTAAGIFRQPPADLGVWNVFANPDFPAPQDGLNAVLNSDGRSPAEALRRTIARFKTPGLRDLGQSGPYLHTGRKRGIEEVLELYVAASGRQRAGRLRNGAPELSGIFLREADIEPIAAFLRSLNEDYQ
jgi:cytochrome c peroxidase